MTQKIEKEIIKFLELNSNMFKDEPYNYLKLCKEGINEIFEKNILKDNPVPSIDKFIRDEIECRGFTPRSSPKSLYYNKICMTESQIIKLIKDTLNFQNGVETDKEQPCPARKHCCGDGFCK